MNAPAKFPARPNLLATLRPGDRVIVCEDIDTFRSSHQICAALQLDVQIIGPEADGSICLSGLQSALYADRHGKVRAVFVSGTAAALARDLLDLAWHDAALVVDNACACAA